MITLDEQVRCVARELALRRNVFPRRVRFGRMTQDEADREIAAMEAVLTTMKRLRADQQPDQPVAG